MARGGELGCDERGRAGMWREGASWDVTRGGELGCGERGRAGMWREEASWDVARGGELGCDERGRAGMWQEGASWDGGGDVQFLHLTANPHAGQVLDIFLIQMSCRTIRVSVAVCQED